MDRRWLSIAVVLLACKKEGFREQMEARFEAKLVQGFGVAAKVTCPEKKPEAGEIIECKTVIEGRDAMVREKMATDNQTEGTISVGGTDFVYVPVDRLNVAIAKSEHAGASIRCAKKSLLLEVGKLRYCELLRDGKVTKMIWVRLDDIAKQAWRWEAFELPPALIEKSLADIGHTTAKVECPPLASEGGSIVCKASIGSETFEVKLDALADGLRVKMSDGRHLVPALLKRDRKLVPVQCAKWVVATDEAVRCTTDGGALEIALDKDGKVAWRDVPPS